MQERIVEKTIILNRDLEKRLEEVISKYPSLNLTLVINQALEEWLRGPQSINPNRSSFIKDTSKGFGPTL